MKISKLLSKKILLFTLCFALFNFITQAQEPVDIWNLEENKQKEDSNKITELQEESVPQNSIYEMQSQKNEQFSIEQDQTLISKEIKIAGLFDPAENGLSINMWSNSNGDQILNIIKRIDKIKLSDDALEILNILLLTNSYYPKNNISKEEFLKIRSNWLIKNSNLNLIEKYLSNNQTINENPELTKYAVDYYLARSEIEKSCRILSKVEENIQNDYLSKFNIYCLINSNKKEKAQLLFDLKKELGFEDKFFEKKINFLMGYNNDPETALSEKTILDFHLSHRTNSEFKFVPKNSTSKEIWKYLSTSNLLDNIKDVELTDEDKITSIEKATHENNYTEKELFELYKRFQFSISQLLNIKESTKVLTAIESRALIYQGILITTDIEKKLQLMNALKNSFKKDRIENAFNRELRLFLKEIDKESIPLNYTSFYEKYADEEKIEIKSIKINNKILHQSKLINYFKEESLNKNITKDLNELLRKIKKDKKYFFSKKDVILVEALKSDGIKVSKKYKDLYEINPSDMPSDMQVFINNGDMGAALLRVVEVIGQDQLSDIDVETMYFIISTLNQLDIDPLRNKILLKILPLKV